MTQEISIAARSSPLGPSCPTSSEDRPVAIHSIDGIGPEVPIVPEYRVRLARYCSRASRAVRGIEIYLRNRGAVPGSRPHFSIPSLGLNLVAAHRWKKQDVMLGRRMKQFTPCDDAPLAPEEARHCCTLVLYSRRGSGSYVGYVERNEFHLSDLPDLDLACMVGAGNFPSRRLPFRISADILRMAIGGYSLPKRYAANRPDVWTLISEFPPIR